MSRLAVSAVLLAALFLAACGGGEQLASERITIKIGAGERADDPQSAVSHVVGIRIGDAVLLGNVNCRGGQGRWNMEHTTNMGRVVTSGEEAVVTLRGPDGTVECPFKFARLLTDKNTCKLGDTELEVHSYYSAGSKWALIVYVP